MTWKAIMDLAMILKSMPTSIIPSDHIGVIRPSSSEDLPAIVLSMKSIAQAPTGIGGLVGAEKKPNGNWIETRGTRASGFICLEVWASSEEDIMELADTLFETIGLSEEMIRNAGFRVFGQRTVIPAERIVLGSQDAFAEKMVVEFNIIYEEITTGETGPEGIIRMVNMNISDGFNEEITIKEPD